MTPENTATSPVDRLAARPWDEIPEHHRHIQASGRRMVFGRDSNEATVLAPWTGPLPEDLDDVRPAVALPVPARHYSDLCWPRWSQGTMTDIGVRFGARVEHPGGAVYVPVERVQVRLDGRWVPLAGVDAFRPCPSCGARLAEHEVFSCAACKATAT
jgi:hypothetical protein